MRETLRLKLLTENIILYQPNIITKITAKPFCVLTLNGSDKDPLISNIFDGDFTIWCYTENLDYSNLDILKELVVITLHNTKMSTSGGYTFKPELINSGNDFYDPDWNAIGIDLTFKYIARIL